MEELSKWVWNESFWLPQGYTWDDFEPTPTVNKPKFTDLYYVPFIATILLCIRYLFERFIALPFCVSIGISSGKSIAVEDNSICECVYTTVTKHPDAAQVNGLAKQLQWSDSRVKRWFYKRRKVSEVPLLKKATESCWRCCLYFFLFLFGSFTVLPTDWFYDTRDWMQGYIREQDFNIFLKSYYLLELAFYTSLLFSQFIDAKRKDFYQMFIHHVVTIMLIFSSFAINHHRIGVAIMWLHDASDYWLEAAKVFNYAKKQKICDGLFVVFAIVFFLTRWIYYPFWVLDAFLFKAIEINGPWGGAHTCLSALLLVLQVLHIYWGFLISQMVHRFLFHGKDVKDSRSDNESSDGESEVVQANATNKKKK